jgi:uncharacterized protein
VRHAIEEGWVKEGETTSLLPAPQSPLDPGETEAIALACATGADVLLIDEKKGREAARSAGLLVGGVLGELLHARQTGAISSLREEIKRLRVEAGFFVDAEIERFILSEAAE